ncbi:MAG: biopolymer transporter ExbD [Verrucomicrobiae bacterium]|nr:biopolymer transporter ExbD [Verrucomicrobiae bacterium]
MASTGTEQDGDYGFQIAPMIDIMFVLILFFMTAAMLKQSENELGIKVPGSRAASNEPPPSEIILAIDPDGTVNFNGKIIGTPTDDNRSALRSRLAEAIDLFGEKQPVILTPHPSVRHERVIEVLNACSAAHVKNLTFGGQ